MHACIDDGLVGPQMEASHVSVLARIYMHVAQKGVVWSLNNQFHNFDVARASETKKSRQWVTCTCSRTRTYSIYASPLPPLRHVLYTTITQTKKILPCWSNYPPCRLFVKVMDDDLAGPQKASYASIECRVGQPSTACGQNIYVWKGCVMF